MFLAFRNLQRRHASHFPHRLPCIADFVYNKPVCMRLSFVFVLLAVSQCLAETRHNAVRPTTERAAAERLHTDTLETILQQALAPEISPRGLPALKRPRRSEPISSEAREWLAVPPLVVSDSGGHVARAQAKLREHARKNMLRDLRTRKFVRRHTAPDDAGTH